MPASVRCLCALTRTPRNVVYRKKPLLSIEGPWWQHIVSTATTTSHLEKSGS